MATKEEYKDTIMRMYDFCIASNHPAQIKEQFTQDLDFLAKLANEHFEEKAETNLEFYYDDLLEEGFSDFAVVNGKIDSCLYVSCDKCEFKKKDCSKDKIMWLSSSYVKPSYKLNKFEYDLLNTYKDSGMQQSIFNYSTLLGLQEKGYFKDIDTSIPIYEILDNCEVIE